MNRILRPQPQRTISGLSDELRAMVAALSGRLEGPPPELAAPVSTLSDIAEATGTRTFAAAQNGQVFYMRLKGLTQDMTVSRYEVEGQDAFVGAPTVYAHAALYQYDNSAPDHYFRLVSGSQTKASGIVLPTIGLECVRTDMQGEVTLSKKNTYVLAFTSLMTGADAFSLRSGAPVVSASTILTQRTVWPYYSSGFTVALGWPQNVRVSANLFPYTGVATLQLPQRELAVPNIDIDAFKFPHFVVPPVSSVIPFL